MRKIKFLFIKYSLQIIFVLPLLILNLIAWIGENCERASFSLHSFGLNIYLDAKSKFEKDQGTMK